MIYLFSFLIYAMVFGVGFYLIRCNPATVERLVGWLCFIGLILQLFVNYLFWGSMAGTFNPLAVMISPERSAVSLMFLALISIFCYASLLVILFKANDFYNE